MYALLCVQCQHWAYFEITPPIGYIWLLPFIKRGSAFIISHARYFLRQPEGHRNLLIWVWVNSPFWYRSCLQVVEDPGANTLGGEDESTFVEAINPNAPNIKVCACSPVKNMIKSKNPHQRPQGRTRFLFGNWIKRMSICVVLHMRLRDWHVLPSSTLKEGYFGAAGDLTKQLKLSLTLQARKKRVRTREGGLATLTVYVSGAPQPDVYWRKDRRDVDTLTGRFRVIDGGTLQVGSAARYLLSQHLCCCRWMANPNQTKLVQPTRRDSHGQWTM